ncbi:hypothetical protein EBM89_14715 [Cellulomonas triticagri]|uniref:Uncharacterized protein n=1 Tax=Cellulomonas triticagri TaxID=2483352 RepID=A0A3M2J7G3_9CELL|nr:hypothetical protein EBM89_14715 [Cellulomonas triticagri]
MSSALAVVVAGATARIAAAHGGPELRWAVLLHGKRGSSEWEFVVPTADAWWVALLVQAVPAVLALVTLVVAHPARSWDSPVDGAPTWLGAVLAPGLAIALVGGFAADAAGRGPDDPGRVLVASSPQVVAFLGFGVVAVCTWVESRRLRRRAPAPVNPG